MSVESTASFKRVYQATSIPILAEILIGSGIESFCPHTGRNADDPGPYNRYLDDRFYIIHFHNCRFYWNIKVAIIG